jgi:hypothetical protein
MGAFEYSESAPLFFRRGDATADGTVELTDAVYLVNHLFLGRQAPDCLDAADANDDGHTDVSDAVADLGFLFLGWPDLPLPGAAACGPDPTADALGCEAYSHCP